MAGTGAAGTGAAAGVPGTGTVGSGTTTPLPKYRAPNKDEADQSIADIKAATDTAAVIGDYAAGMPLGPFVAGGIKVLGDHFAPSIDNYVRNTPTVPVYENWDENDFNNAFAGK